MATYVEELAEENKMQEIKKIIKYREFAESTLVNVKDLRKKSNKDPLPGYVDKDFVVSAYRDAWKHLTEIRLTEFNEIGLPVWNNIDVIPVKLLWMNGDELEISAEIPNIYEPENVHVMEDLSIVQMKRTEVGEDGRNIKIVSDPELRYIKPKEEMNKWKD